MKKFSIITYIFHSFRLHIYDYQNDGKATQITPPQGLYGLFDVYYHGRSRGVEDYMSTSDRLKLDYQGHPTLAYDGFKILITTFKGINSYFIGVGRGGARGGQAPPII